MSDPLRNKGGHRSPRDAVPCGARAFNRQACRYRRSAGAHAVVLVRLPANSRQSTEVAAEEAEIERLRFFEVGLRKRGRQAFGLPAGYFSGTSISYPAASLYSVPFSHLPSSLRRAHRFALPDARFRRPVHPSVQPTTLTGSPCPWVLALSSQVSPSACPGSTRSWGSQGRGRRRAE